MDTSPNRAKPVSLLEIGDSYVQATWHHPDSATEIIAIYRDMTPENTKEDFVMAQPLRGPWSVYDPQKGLHRDPEIAPKAREEVSAHAEAILHDLNYLGLDTVKLGWSDSGGTVYDY